MLVPRTRISRRLSPFARPSLKMAFVTEANPLASSGMFVPQHTDVGQGLLAGHRAVPLRAEDESSPLRVCVVVRDPSDPVAGPFVLLRATADVAIYLGCVTDAQELVR